MFKTSVAKPHLFYAAPAQGENLDAAPAYYTKPKFLKGIKVNIRPDDIFSSDTV
jgi:hypothetical protein